MGIRKLVSDQLSHWLAHPDCLAAGPHAVLSNKGSHLITFPSGLLAAIGAVSPVFLGSECRSFTVSLLVEPDELGLIVNDTDIPRGDPGVPREVLGTWVLTGTVRRHWIC